MLVVIKWKFPIDSQRDVIREGLIAEGKTSIHVIAAAVQKSFIFSFESLLPPRDPGWPPERLPLPPCRGVRRLVISLWFLFRDTCVSHLCSAPRRITDVNALRHYLQTSFTRENADAPSPRQTPLCLQRARRKSLSAFQKGKGENLWIQLPFLWLWILQSINL